MPHERLGPPIGRRYVRSLVFAFDWSPQVPFVAQNLHLNSGVSKINQAVDLSSFHVLNSTAPLLGRRVLG